MQFLGKLGKIVYWRPPPGELAPPPWGNPRSATGDFVQFIELEFDENLFILEKLECIDKQTFP